ncbi:MAG: LuxR C-terminal-related transcriptional regulator [Rhodococcus sp. (in: high G+C Gram-positive bacteria)]|uniref:LuxR C-terminal-related transcriptional regulator n=1 Tax=Rhodococcus sp. TaxID=1831 RepID=UPI003BAE4F89
MPEAVSAIRNGHAFFIRRNWRAAYSSLLRADGCAPLCPEDLECLATAAYLIGEDEASVDAWTRAQREWGALGNRIRAARCAFWLGMGLMLRGQLARASGWMGKAGRLLDTANTDCPEQGYLLIPRGLGRLTDGDGVLAHDTFREVTEIGERFEDPDLTSLGLLGTGQGLILLGRHAEGVRAFDEAMVCATATDVSPVVTGIVYCAVIEQCQAIFDLRRSREWTAALTQWCSTQPDLVPYRGQCLVHRAEILQLQGCWPEAMDAARCAHERLSHPTEHPAVGSASYVLGELHRLRGEFAHAEQCYLEANRWGRLPQPGLSLLRMVQGRIGSALASISREIDAAAEPALRARLLPACAEIGLSAGDVAAARNAADELCELGAVFDVPYMHALAAHTSGSVLLAEARTPEALTTLRDASARWREIGAPYEEARARELIGLTCRALGDEDTASIEFGQCAAVYRQLGAIPDLTRVESTHRPRIAPTGPLTPRELDVLRLVAAGKSNRVVADELVLSEKTVARHLSNIFLKLGISSRSAATAYAYEHHVVEPST